MQLTKNQDINAFILQLHDVIMTTITQVVHREIPGFRSNQYGFGTTMNSSVCYIICYDQKANLGFDNGIHLVKDFPLLKGTGKFHRHVAIDATLLNNKTQLSQLILQAFTQAGLKRA